MALHHTALWRSVLIRLGSLVQHEKPDRVQTVPPFPAWCPFLKDPGGYVGRGSYPQNGRIKTFLTSLKLDPSFSISYFQPSVSLSNNL